MNEGGLFAELLELLLDGDLSKEVALEIVCRHIDTRIGDCRASVTELDTTSRTLTMVAGPGLAVSYRASAKAVPIGDYGACSRAAWLGAPAICCDVFTDAHFEGLTALCERYDFGAAWSFPVFEASGDVAGTLGLYFAGRRRAPSDRERDFLLEMARIVAVVLSHGRVPREGERAMVQLLEQGRDVLLSLDGAHRVAYASPSAKRLLGVEAADTLDTVVTDLFVASDRGRVTTFLDHMIQGGGPATLDDVKLLAGEHERFFRLSAAPLHGVTGAVKGITVSMQDVTERRRLERRMRFAERMSSVGALSAGIAHEINNPLAFLQANVQYVREQLDRVVDAGGDDLLAALDDALDGAQRVATIVHDLKMFSRGESARREPVVLRPVVESALRMSRPEVSTVARVRVDVPHDLEVLGDGTHLGQVLVNLMLNAAQAFPEDAPEENRIEIEARAVGEGAILEVRDNGPGIEPAIRKRIFEPFFTTKAVDRGSGLGLAVVHGIVQGMGGTIEVESEVGVGTCFRIHCQCPLARRLDPPKPRAAARRRGAARVLFVDDEVALGEAFRRLLRGVYDVTYVSNAAAALEVLERDADFDLCVLDVMMPEVDGLSLAGLIRERHPQLARRIVFLTGGVDERRQTAAGRAGWRHFVRKPISREAFEDLFECVATESAEAPVSALA